MSAISKTLDSRPSPTDDLFDCILVQLPVKSLKRFQAVNKSWAALISQPDFVEKHLTEIKKKTNRFQILLQTLISDFHFVRDPDNENFIKCFKPLPETRPLRSIDYEATLKNLKEDEAALIAPRELDSLEMINNTDSNPVIFGSVNGLICIEFDQTDIVIWNPSTKESKLLPQATVIDDDISIASVFYGFGYDDKNKDYKVVRASIRGEYASNGVTWSRNIIIEVFSLKTGSWRTSQVINCMGSEDLGIDGQGCLVNETLHWLDQRGRVLRSFDLVEEKFGESVQDLSSIMREDTYLGGAFNIENCLVVFCLTYDYHSEIKTKEYQIWVMKDIAVPESWTEVANFISEEFMKPICISEGGEVLAVIGKAVAWFSPKENLVKNVVELDGTIVATKYIETLVSPLTGSVAGKCVH